MLLAGDIGGTRTRLAAYTSASGALSLVHTATYPSRSAATLEELIVRFLAESGKPAISAACFGVAGAVVNGQVRATNLPWEVTESGLAGHLGIPRVRIVNDLEAAAHGVLSITDRAGFHTLQEGMPSVTHRTCVLVTAGTGLGVAVMTWDGHEYQVAPSEGGHSDFAPQDEVEDALLLWLRARFAGHVSYERALSGPGLVNVYRFLRDYRNQPEPSWITERIGDGDPAPVISELALSHGDAVCDEALTRFASIYGAAAGNFALTTFAMGGVFIGGAIAAKNLARLTEGGFLQGFQAKGRFTANMRAIPVYVVLTPDVALLGAASCVATTP